MGPSSFSSPVLKTTKWREQAKTICQLYLTRCTLGIFNIENFQREKLTVDQICKLSSEEMDPEHHNEETTQHNEVTTTHNEETTPNNDKQPHEKVMAFHKLSYFIVIFSRLKHS